jgi:hypothetical protein
MRSGKPPLLVVEDGREYVERFTRSFGAEFELVRADDAVSALAACADGPRGLLLDLDFSRVPADRLVDEEGRTGARTKDEARRLAQMQGILILRVLRGAAVTLPALLFADLDDRARAGFLEQSLAPLEVIPSSESLSAIADRLRRWRESG